MTRKFAATLLLTLLPSLGVSQTHCESHTAPLFEQEQLWVITKSVEPHNLGQLYELNNALRTQLDRWPCSEVLEADKGIWALTIGKVPRQGANELIEDWKSRGLLPEDSYASSGRSFYDRIDARLVDDIIISLEKTAQAEQLAQRPPRSVAPSSDLPASRPTQTVLAQFPELQAAELIMNGQWSQLSSNHALQTYVHYILAFDAVCHDHLPQEFLRYTVREDGRIVTEIDMDPAFKPHFERNYDRFKRLQTANGLSALIGAFTQGGNQLNSVGSLAGAAAELAKHRAVFQQFLTSAGCLSDEVNLLQRNLVAYVENRAPETLPAASVAPQRAKAPDFLGLLFELGVECTNPSLYGWVNYVENKFALISQMSRKETEAVEQDLVDCIQSGQFISNLGLTGHGNPSGDVFSWQIYSSDGEVWGGGSL